MAEQQIEQEELAEQERQRKKADDAERAARLVESIDFPPTSQTRIATRLQVWREQVKKDSDAAKKDKAKPQ